MDENLKSKIYTAFASTAQTDVNFALELLKLILEQDTKLQGETLQYICELWGTIRTSEAVQPTEIISKVEFDKLKKLYGDIVDATLVSYISLGLLENWDRKQFYEKLWEAINSNIPYDSKEKKAFALYYIAIDCRTPYYNIGTGLKMNNDDYSQIQEEIYESFRKFVFIESLSFDQKTEKSSLILKVIDDLDDKKKRIVLLSKIINYYEHKVDKIIQKVKERE